MLAVIAGYLKAYTKALHGKPTPERPFRKAYIDAFAGTGSREARPSGSGDNGLLFPDLAHADSQALLDGSARIALKTEPQFDRYIFIERSSERCAQLQALKADFPDLAGRIDVRKGDANAAIQRICAKDWRSSRAVLFLDPYGMQVAWETIEAVAKTKAIDTWILFPLIGVNRLLMRSGDIPHSWRQRLDMLLGTKAWFDEFYKLGKTTTLFGPDEKMVKKASKDTISRFFVSRLRSIFCEVADKPRVLSNSSNSPLYLLCFAVGNEAGASIALRIANHLLNKVED